jgi:hypothetical protein
MGLLIRSRGIRTAAFLVFLAHVPAAGAIDNHTSTLTRIIPAQDGQVEVLTNTNASSCNKGDNNFNLKIGENSVTPEAARNIYAAFLFAMALGKTVTIYFNENSAQCYVQRVHVIN